MEYRKKPVVVEAIQWTGLNLEEIKTFVGESLKYDIIDTAWKAGAGAPNVNMKIHTLEGDHECTKGDYIIKGVKGEFYPCKPDIFEESYEIARKCGNNVGNARKAGPIEVFESQEELNECLKWWQHKLFLDGWIIKAIIVDEIMFNGEKVEDAVGFNELCFQVSQSRIQILSEKSHNALGSLCTHICMEQTLVHELLHCIYNWIDGNESYEGVYLMGKEHQQIEQMSKTLIMAKYNLDYDYFMRD